MKSAAQGVLLPQGKANSSGVGALDAILQGGWPRGQLNALSGPSGSGKTTIAIYTMMATLREYPARSALWIDTLGVFDAARLQTMASAEMLHRIHILRTLDMHELSRAVEHIENEVFVAIDNISAPFTLATVASVEEEAGMVTANSLLVSLLRTLQRTVQADACIILVNAVIPSNVPCGAFASTTFRPMLGKTFMHCTDLHVLLSSHKRSHKSNESVTVAEVLYARSTNRAGHWTTFSF